MMFLMCIFAYEMLAVFIRSFSFPRRLFMFILSFLSVE